MKPLMTLLSNVILIMYLVKSLYQHFFRIYFCCDVFDENVQVDTG